uniref:Nuclear pore complex protein Nup50 n=2 Tax=Culex pipiens TaxID=7175 RepID=A0A8D8B9A0_CULPI
MCCKSSLRLPSWLDWLGSAKESRLTAKDALVNLACFWKRISSAGANTAAAPTPFSFGFGSTSSTPRTGFIFANLAKPTEDSKPDEKASADDDEVEFTPVKEKDSIFSKRFKLFGKADGNYSHRDIGTLHIKKVDGKVQVGQILLNIILNEAVPVQGMGKNNVIMVCVPTPEKKPPSVLLPVKNGEEADDLYETLNKYKPK